MFLVNVRYSWHKRRHMLSRQSGSVRFMKKTLESVNQLLTAFVIPNTLLIKEDFPTPDYT